MEGLRLANSGEYKQTQKFSLEVFHTVNRILPENQQVLKVPPDMEAQKAIRLMIKNGYSQVPVVSGTAVLGVFSFRSFAQGALKMGCENVDPRELPVDDFVERVPFVRVTDDQLEALRENIDQYSAVLVGEERRLQGILTSSNIMDYLRQIAKPYFLMSEIELGLRQMIRLSVNDDQLTVCIMSSLRKEKSLEEMVFAEYDKLIFDEKHWDYFEPVFGNLRERTQARFNGIRIIRNAIFHFKRELSPEEHEALAGYRDWTWRRIKSVEGRRKGGIND
ncbi:MAG: CBS domain-containing protein [Desulfomonilaceae bacterium]